LEDNITMDLIEIGWSMEQISCEQGNAPSGSIYAGKFFSG
jgi:hypothetical protein